MTSLENISTIVDIVVKILGSIAAATWTLFAFLKERRLRPRLELHISGKIISINKGTFAIATVQIKNAGLAKVDIDKIGSALLIYPLSSQEDVNNWNHFEQVLPIMEEHQWIEPGETIEDTVLIYLKEKDEELIKLHLRLNSKNVTWEIDAFIEKSSHDQTT